MSETHTHSGVELLHPHVPSNHEMKSDDDRSVAYEDFDHERPSTAATSEPELHRSHDPYSAFRFFHYRAYAIGNFGSVIGRQMLSIAVEWETYQRTHSAA